jgi:cob(I)alamin adenosyltransferase
VHLPRDSGTSPMAKIYTRTGDSGETELFGGKRLSKSDPRIEAIGSVDETSAALGVVRVELGRSGVAPAGLDELVTLVQHRLFDLGAELAMPDKSDKYTGGINDADVVMLEAEIDRCDANLQPLREFILPGGSAAAAQLHVARGACRRAERRLVELAAAEPLRGELIRFLNRLSDLLFVLARVTNQANRIADVTWKQRPKT